MDLNRYKELLLKQEFQNIVQGVHALNSARNSLCDLIENQWKQFIATLPTTEKEQLGTFIRCVNQHGIVLDFANINNEDLGCGHKNCELLYIRLRKLSCVTGDISVEQDRQSLLQEKQHNLSNTDSCISFIWDLAHCFIGVKTQDVKLHGREMNAKTLIKLMKNCRMFAFKDSEKIYGQVLEDIDKLIYAKDLLISNEDREMLFDHLLVLLRHWQNNCQSCSYGVEDIEKMQHDMTDCELFEYQFLVKNVLEIIKNMLDDSESECDLPENINSKDVSSSKELISSLLSLVEQQDDYLEEEHKTLEMDRVIEVAMDNNQEDHLDKQSGMDDQAKMKLFKIKADGNQPSRKETMTPKSRHYQQESDASVIKGTSPRKETENTYRIFSSPQESQKGTEEKATTSNESRASPSLESSNGTDQETPATRKSSRWNPTDLEVFNHPMCLISANEDGEEGKIMLKSEEEVFEQIKQIDLPLVVVAVTGLYRTGKSYLTNCLAQSKGGFELGNTIQSKTEGIWVWCKMHPTQKNTVLVLLDTEGLGDVEKGDQNHDNNLFTLAALLCNCLVYNMMGAFNNEAVSKLTLVTAMAKNIRYRGKSSEDNQALNLILPEFVLCLRDFTLELKYNGEAISANEYLETSLAEKKGKAVQFNKPRECIRKYFPKRECFVFPMPGDTRVIRKLERLSFDDLCDNFKEAIRTFVSYIYDIPPKEMSGSKPINGEMFVTLVDRYVTAIRHGAVPDVDDAFTAAAKIENAKIEKQALELFENQMVKIIPPVPEHVLRCNYTKVQQAALEYLRQNAVHDTKAECEKQAQMKMDEFWNTIKEDNDTKVQEMCETKLQDNAYKRCIEEKIRNRYYETAGGFRKFQLDVERLREDFVSTLRDFEEIEIVWTWHGFIKSIKESEARIVEADENLSAKEKEDEQRRNQENIDKLIKEQQKAQQEALEKQKRDLESHYKKLDEDRNQQIKVDVEKYEALVNDKYEKQIAQKEIEDYKKKQKERMEMWLPVRLWKALCNTDD